MTTIEILLNINLLEINWFNSESMTSLALKFVINLIITYFIVIVVYRPNNDKTEFIFTYFVFNILIFFLCHLMLSTQLTLGFAFGLFALFSIMRYRTMTIDIKDMTYLFAVVCVAVMNALSGFYVSVGEQIFINIAILGSLFLLESILFKQGLVSQQLVYENIEFIKPQHEQELKADLENRIGRPIKKIKVVSLNYLNDSAVLNVQYSPSEQLSTSMNTTKTQQVKTPVTEFHKD